MSTNGNVRDLFRSLEQTLHDRLRFTEDVIMCAVNAAIADAQRPPNPPQTADREKVWELRVQMLEEKVNSLTEELGRVRRAASNAAALLPPHPLEGLEVVVPKREVVLPAAAAPEPEAISAVDRLLLNRRALKALEAKEMGETGVEDHAEMETGGGDTEEEEAEAVEEEAVEEEAVEEEAVEEEAVEEEAEEAVEEEAEEAEEAEAVEEAVELEEFEYKGATYLRDAENNVYMTDEDGELIEEPIGTWNESKQRIIVAKKPAA